MFWGLQMEPNLRYSQQVPEGFRITKATLLADSSSSNDKIVQVFVEQEGTDYAIATLKHGGIFDCTLDLRFAEGEDICFYLKGEGVVFLTGHNLYPDDDDGQDDSVFVRADDSDSEDEEESSEVESDSDESSGPEIEDITEKLATQKSKANGKLSNGLKSVSTKSGNSSSVNPESEDDDDDDNDDDADEDEDEDFEGGVDEESEDSEIEDSDSAKEDVEALEDERKQHVKKQIAGIKRPTDDDTVQPKTPVKRNKTQNGTPKAEIKQEQKKGETPKGAKKSLLRNEDVTELKVDDIVVGHGPVAKRGRTVHVYYAGTLLNGKKFDSLLNGRPFAFKLGAGKVIKGWDKGLEGMKVGGKRRLTIPAKLGYGNQPTGPIPANSVLCFDIELKAVN